MYRMAVSSPRVCHDAQMRAVRTFVLAGVLCGALVAATPAAAATTCTYDSATKTVTVTLGDPLVILSVEAGAITFVGAHPAVPERLRMPRVSAGGGGAPQPCGGATTTNTDTILITGGAPRGTIVIADQTNGSFAPGATAEGTGVSEIEFTVDPAGPAFMIFSGTSAPDLMRLGTAGLNLDGDDDVDATFGAQVGAVGLDGLGGNDDLSALGDAVTGGPTRLPYLAAGGPGTDLLVGASGDDELIGMGGRDRVVGSAGRDRIAGGAGKDRLAGGPGGDLLVGQGGRDRLAGGPKRDLMDGGGGSDRCVGGPGRDEVRACER